MFNPDKYRPLFPVTENQTYLNHAATSPYSIRVVEALQSRIDNRSRGKIDDYDFLIEKADRLKQLFSELIQVPVDRISHTKNTSEGLNIIARGLSWKSGDRVLLYKKEFPANVWPFLNLREKGVIIDFFETESEKITPEIIEKNLHKNTRLFSLSFVQFLNGFRSDLRAISDVCKKRGVIFVVDGIQGLGAVPLSASDAGIDALSCGLHKWLMSPQGTGFLYLSEELQDKLTPSFVSWLSVKTPWDFFNHSQELKDTADVFEYGTYNSNGIVGACAALGLLLEVGVENIFNHLVELGNLFTRDARKLGYEILSDTDYKYRSGITLFSHRDREKNPEIFKALVNSGVTISLRDNLLRVSPHFYNNEEDIGKLLEICAKFT